MFLSVLSACMSVHHRQVLSAEETKEDIPLELDLKTVVSCHVMLGIEPRSLGEQPVLFTTEPALQPSQSLKSSIFQG